MAGRPGATALPARFVDDGREAYGFTAEVFVVCPRCRARAIVKGWHDRPSRVSCPSCSFERRGVGWMGPMTASCTRYCRTCLRRITSTRRLSGPPTHADVRVPCAGCGEVVAAPYVLFPDSAVHKFLDPRLGLPLWLQTPCVGETLWAYSYEHIAALERFIGATLRGDPHIRTHRSMPQKLPRWMQLAKHRDAVRDGLQRLAQR